MLILDQVKEENSSPMETDNNNTTDDKKEEIKTSSIPAQVFQSIVRMFPEKSWTEDDIRTRYRSNDLLYDNSG